MYHFSITDPFVLNWKYVAPKDFDTLEVFLKPGLSIELSNIVSGPKKFSVGAFLTNGNNRAKFNNELLPARSDERIKAAFKKEEVSCFFSPEEAKELKELFEKEEFICRQVKVKSVLHGEDFFALPTDEYGLVLDFFSQTNVQQTADIKESRELFEALRDDAVKEVRTEVRRQQHAEAGGKLKRTPKAVKIQAAIGSGLILLGAVFKKTGNAVATKGLVGAMAAVVFAMLSAVSSLFGVRLFGAAAELYLERM